MLLADWIQKAGTLWRHWIFLQYLLTKGFCFILFLSENNVFACMCMCPSVYLFTTDRAYWTILKQRHILVELSDFINLNSQLLNNFHCIKYSISCCCHATILSLNRGHKWSTSISVWNIVLFKVERTHKQNYVHLTEYFHVRSADFTFLYRGKRLVL